MIEILNISQEACPEVEFKVLNLEPTATHLRSFTLSVLESRIDPAPEFSFRTSILESSGSNSPPLSEILVSSEAIAEFLQRAFPSREHGCLAIAAQNDGWGPALDAVFVVSEPTLDDLFDEEQRRFTHDVPASQAVWLHTVPKAFDNGKFLRLHRELRKEARLQMEREFSDTRQHEGAKLSEEDYLKEERLGRLRFVSRWQRGLPESQVAADAPGQTKLDCTPTIPLERLVVRWRCRGSSDMRFSGLGEARSIGPLCLGQNGVIWGKDRLETVDPGPGFWGGAYCVVIDADSGPHERLYYVIKALPAAGSLRFNLKIAATKSCELRLRFRFATDSGQVMCSKPFELKIWCPSGPHPHFVDSEPVLG